MTNGMNITNAVIECILSRSAAIEWPGSDPLVSGIGAIRPIRNEQNDAEKTISPKLNEWWPLTASVSNAVILRWASSR